MIVFKRNRIQKNRLQSEVNWCSKFSDGFGNGLSQMKRKNEADQLDETIHRLYTEGKTVWYIEDTLEVGWTRYRNIIKSPPGTKLFHKRAKNSK